MPFGLSTRVGPRNHVLDGGFRNLETPGRKCSDTLEIPVLQVGMEKIRACAQGGECTTLKCIVLQKRNALHVIIMLNCWDLYKDRIRRKIISRYSLREIWIEIESDTLHLWVGVMVYHHYRYRQHQQHIVSYHRDISNLACETTAAAISGWYSVQVSCLRAENLAQPRTGARPQTAGKLGVCISGSFE